MGKSTSRPHRRSDERDVKVTEEPIPKVHLDYFYVNSEDEKKGENPMIIMMSYEEEAMTTMPAGRKCAEGN